VMLLGQLAQPAGAADYPYYSTQGSEGSEKQIGRIALDDPNPTAELLYTNLNGPRGIDAVGPGDFVDGYTRRLGDRVARRPVVSDGAPAANGASSFHVTRCVPAQIDSR